MKKALSILLAAAMLFAMLPFGASAAQGDPADTGAQIEAAPLGSKENPYKVDNYDFLRSSINRWRPAGETLYVKLTRDIKFSGDDGSLSTNGTDVNIDLAGYTLACDHEKTSFMSGSNGKFIIRDSRRYDDKKGKWIDGRIEYEFKKFSGPEFFISFTETRALRGDIVVEGGTIVNKNSNSERIDAVYEGSSLQMTGGTLEGGYPIRLTNSSGNTSITGGTLRIKTGVGIKIDSIGTHVYGHFTVAGCKMINDTEHSYTGAFSGEFSESFYTHHSGVEAMDFWNESFPEDTYAFIDGVRQPKGSTGVWYDGLGDILGPAFYSTYELAPIESVDTVNISIREPKVRETLPYSARVPAGSSYNVVAFSNGSDWKYGVQWTDGNHYNSPYHDGDVFEGNKWYTVFIKLGVRDSTKYLFADADSISATVNDHKALVYSSGEEEITVYYTFKVEPETVSDIALSIRAPKKNEHPSFDATAPAGSMYRVQTSNNANGYIRGVGWMDVDDHLRALTESDTFDIGSYSVIILIELTDTRYCAFADSSVITATVNGKAAAAVPYSSTGYGIFCNFELSTAIKNVDITIPEPVAYETPSYDATLPSDALYKLNVHDEEDPYSHNGVLWEEGIYVFPDNYGFIPGKEYTVSVTVELIDKANYRFADSYNIRTTVNGKAASVRFYEDLCIVSYTFSVAPPPAEIDCIEVTVPDPANLEVIGYTATVPAGAGYAVEDKTTDVWKDGVRWAKGSSFFTNDTDYYFHLGKQYTVEVSLVLTDPDSYIFAPLSEMTATVNGDEAEVIKVDDNNYVVSYEFTVTDKRTEIDSIVVNITEPEEGAILPYTASVPEGALYAVEVDFSRDYLGVKNGIAWWLGDSYVDAADDHYFEAGGQYTLRVNVEIVDSEKYKFADSEVISVTVNGREGSVRTVYDDDNYVIACGFEIPGGASIGLLGDVDRSGKVNIFDASYILKGTTGTSGYPDYSKLAADSDELRHADVDKNGMVNVFDAALVLRYTTGDANAIALGIGKEI